MKRKTGTEQVMMIETMTTHRTNRLRLLASVAVVVTSLFWGSVLHANVLKEVQVAESGDADTALVLVLDEKTSRPVNFTTTNPPRIIIDLANTSNGLKRYKPFVATGPVKNMQVVEAGGRTRLIFDLTRMLPYEVRTEGNRIYLALNKVSETVSTASDAGFVMDDKAGMSPSITNIDFRRGEKGEGVVEITFSNEGVVADVHKTGDRIIADFRGVTLPPHLEQRFDVTDFATPVTAVDGYAKEGGAELVVTAVGPYDYKLYQSGNRMSIRVSELKKQAKKTEKKPGKRYTGERLSLDFQDIEVRAALKIIAEFTNQNIVASDSVTGNITLHLKNVPWDEALDIILTTKGLDMRRRGNVILVAPAEEIAAREKFDMETQKKQEELAPLVSESIQVNYAKAADIAALFNKKKNSRGSIAIDERTNRILVTDTYENIQKMRAQVAELDVPVRQVMIESRIVIANNDFSRNLGARFGITAVGKNGGNGIIGTTGSAAGTDTMVGSALDNIQGGGEPLPVNMPSLGDRYNVNLPVINPAGQFALALLGKDYLLDLELSALQMEGRGEVLSNPRVITSNRSEAVIEQGVEIPYQQATSSGATSVSFKKAVLSLKVVPQITPDDRIIMDLNVTKDSVGQVFNGVPSINSREVKTQVLVRDGDTVVLGGIYEQTRSKEVDSVPLLGDLPVIGALFRQTRKVDDKAELLIFITPKIIRENTVVR